MLGETRWEKCRFRVRSRILRLMMLSSTMRVRKPPGNGEEKDSRDLCRDLVSDDPFMVPAGDGGGILD